MQNKTMVVLPVIFTEEEAQELTELFAKIHNERTTNGLEGYKREHEFLVAYIMPFIFEHIKSNIELELEALGYYERTGEFH